MGKYSAVVDKILMGELMVAALELEHIAKVDSFTAKIVVKAVYDARNFPVDGFRGLMAHEGKIYKRLVKHLPK